MRSPGAVIASRGVLQCSSMPAFRVAPNGVNRDHPNRVVQPRQIMNPSARWADGSAIFTMVVSRTTISCVTATTDRITQRRSESRRIAGLCHRDHLCLQLTRYPGPGGRDKVQAVHQRVGPDADAPDQRPGDKLVPGSQLYVAVAGRGDRLACSPHTSLITASRSPSPVRRSLTSTRSPGTALMIPPAGGRAGRSPGLAQMAGRCCAGLAEPGFPAAGQGRAGVPGEGAAAPAQAFP